MDIQTITGYFQTYGVIAIFTIVFLEYLNLPGFPAGIILPLAGIFAKQGNISFLQAFLLSVLAGLFGSLLLYFLGRLGGEIFLEKYLMKFPKHRPAIEKTMRYINDKGCLGILLAKQVPMIRTIISIPAGVLKFQIVNYTIYSAIGIAIWNLVFMGAGYFLGDVVFSKLG